MTPDEINRAIAESQGAILDDFEGSDFAYWDKSMEAMVLRFTDCVSMSLLHGERLFARIPNYHGDLNAIQQAVMTLSKEGVRSKYNQILMDSLKPDEAFVLDRAINATAPQRCEAYLRTIGKWRDK